MNAHYTTWVRFEENPSPVLAKIESFANLQPGWDYGDGVPASASTISLARDIYHESLQLGFTRANAFPGTDGAIQLTIYESESTYIIIMIKPSGAVSLERKINKEKTNYSIVDGKIYDIRKCLREIAIEKWNIYVSLTPPNMIISGGVTLKSLFVITNPTDARPLLTRAA